MTDDSTTADFDGRTTNGDARTTAPGAPRSPAQAHTTLRVARELDLAAEIRDEARRIRERREAALTRILSRWFAGPRVTDHAFSENPLQVRGQMATVPGGR